MGAMIRPRVGVMLPQQHATLAELRSAWRTVDAAGFDSLWIWDHFFPLSGDEDGSHFEAWSLLAAIAVETERVQIGTLVTSTVYRNPDLLADMARTVDHLSAGRLALGVGAGGRGDRDYAEYGYEAGDGPERVRRFEAAVDRIERRLSQLNPPPLGSLPLLIAGFGERVMLRIVAQHAQMWNVGGPPEEVARKNAVLDGWCQRVGRDPKEIERTVILFPEAVGAWRSYVEAGMQHLILAAHAPFDLGPARRVLAEAREER
jgi:probable F420-dependent oxidoreductase